MSPSRRKAGTYRPKRDRREVTTAVLTGVAILVFTAVMVWVLGPHDSGGDSSPTTTTVPAAANTTVPAAPDTTTVPAAASTTVPAAPDTTTTAPVPGG